MNTKTSLTHIQAIVTADNACIKKGKHVELARVDKNSWLVVKSNGRSVYPFSVFLKAGQFEQL